MIKKISLQKFFNYAKIDYKEDLFMDIYSDYIRYDRADIVNRLPKKYEYLENKLDNPAIFEAVERAINRADEIATIDEAERVQYKAVEKQAEYLTGLINNIIAGAVKSIVINWREDQVILDLDTKKCASAIVEIINGEGYFGYDSTEDFITSYNGKNEPREAVVNHLHYLLNGKLIAEIYGDRWSFDWQSDGGYADDEIIADEIADQLAEYEASEAEKKDNHAYIAGAINQNLDSVADILAEYSTKKDLNASILRNIKSIKTILKS